MAMLAEGRRKQKISTNPNGNEWRKGMKTTFKGRFKIIHSCHFPEKPTYGAQFVDKTHVCQTIQNFGQTFVRIIGCKLFNRRTTLTGTVLSIICAFFLFPMLLLFAFASFEADENKFGQKLMEKMGWSSGKGLGAKEDGNVDHVGISLKADKKGVGCSKSQVDNWIAHQDDFSALLSQLNEDHRGNAAGGDDSPAADTDSPSGSAVLKMEEKSRNAKGRVHYQKFTKGKDLSLKSGKDLDCVFGKRKSQSGTNTPDVQASSDESEETQEHNHGVNTIRSSDSIQEYFARKMAEKRNKSDTNLETENTADCSDTKDPTQDTLPSGETKKKKKSKKDKKKAKEAEMMAASKQEGENDYPEARVSFMIGGQEEGSDEAVNDVKSTGEELEKVADDGNDVEKTEKKKSKKSKKNKRRHEDAFGDNCDGSGLGLGESVDKNSKDVTDSVAAQQEGQKKKKSKKQKKRERESM